MKNVLDRLSEMVAIESAEDLYLDLHIAANPDEFSSDALEEDPVVTDIPFNDVDTLAGIGSEVEEMDIPEDEDLPSLYALRMRSDPDYEHDVPFNALPADPTIAVEDLPEESPFYDTGEDDGIFEDEDAEFTQEELDTAETIEELMEMAWQRKSRRALIEALDDSKSKPTTLDADKGGKTDPNPLDTASKKSGGIQ